MTTLVKCASTSRIRTAALAALCAVALASSGVGAAGGQDRSQEVPAGSGRIRGTVTRTDTGGPLRFIEVRVSAPGTPGSPWTTTTDAGGRFEVTGLPAASYVVTPTAPQFAQPGTRAASIPLAEGQTLDDLHIRLSPGGVIEGTVLDEYGDPVVAARVQALRAEYLRMPGMSTTGQRASDRRLIARGLTQTDDRGRFRLYGLESGQYFVMAERGAGNRGLLSGLDEPSPTVMRGGSGFAPTFYPGTASIAESQPLDVRAGTEATGVSFTLTAERLSRVSGTVLSSRGVPTGGMGVLMMPARQGVALLVETQMVETGPDGGFALDGVPPGSYRVVVVSLAAFAAVAESGGPGSLASGEMGSLLLPVSGQDIDNLVIATSRGHTVTGRVRVEGDPSALAPTWRLSVGAIDLAAGESLAAAMLHRSGPVQPDGSFEIPNVIGSRLFRVTGLPAGWTLKAVHVYGRDVADTGFDVQQDIGSVDIVLSTRPAEVQGRVGAEREPCAGCAVIVFPQDPGRWEGRSNRFIRGVETAADGTFGVPALPEGRYYAVAVEALLDGVWAEPAYLFRMRARAVAFSVSEGEVASVDLPMPVATF
jgi:hypothetical protein